MAYKQHIRDLARMSQLVADYVEEKLKEKLDKDKAKIESLEAKLTRLRDVAKKAEANNTKTDLVTSESLRQKLGESLASTEHQFFQMHSRFEKVEWIWKEEFTVLVDRLNEQQRVLPYTLVFKLFGSLTFDDFINACVKAQIDGAVTEALEMVKDDYLDVNVAQSKYRVQVGDKQPDRQRLGVGGAKPSLVSGH